MKMAQPYVCYEDRVRETEGMYVQVFQSQIISKPQILDTELFILPSFCFGLIFIVAVPFLSCLFLE